MENLIIVFIKKMLKRTIEIRKYSLDPKTAIYLNYQWLNADIFHDITIIQLLAILLTFILRGTVFAIPFTLFFLYYVLVLRAEWATFVNARNHVPNIINNMPFYGTASLLAMLEMLLVITMERLNFVGIQIVIMELFFYLAQFACFLIAEKRLTNNVETDKICMLAPDEETIILIRKDKDEKEYHLKEFFLLVNKGKYIIMNRNYHVEKTFPFQEYECQIGQRKILPPQNNEE